MLCTSLLQCIKIKWNDNQLLHSVSVGASVDNLLPLCPWAPDPGPKWTFSTSGTPERLTLSKKKKKHNTLTPVKLIFLNDECDAQVLILAGCLMHVSDWCYVKS